MINAVLCFECPETTDALRLCEVCIQNAETLLSTRQAMKASGNSQMSLSCRQAPMIRAQILQDGKGSLRSGKWHTQYIYLQAVEPFTHSSSNPAQVVQGSVLTHYLFSQSNLEE